MNEVDRDRSFYNVIIFLMHILRRVTSPEPLACQHTTFQLHIFSVVTRDSKVRPHVSASPDVYGEANMLSSGHSLVSAVKVWCESRVFRFLVGIVIAGFSFSTNFLNAGESTTDKALFDQLMHIAHITTWYNFSRSDGE